MIKYTPGACMCACIAGDVLLPETEMLEKNIIYKIFIGHWLSINPRSHVPAETLTVHQETSLLCCVCLIYFKNSQFVRLLTDQLSVSTFINYHSGNMVGEKSIISKQRK